MTIAFLMTSRPTSRACCAVVRVCARTETMRRRAPAIEIQACFRMPGILAAIRAFVVEQPLLAPAAPTVAAERSVGADYAVARNHDCDTVLTVDAADSPDGVL